MGAKYKNLDRLQHDYQIPPFFLLSPADLERLWVNADSIINHAKDVLNQIKITSGGFIDVHLKALSDLPAPVWVRDADLALVNLLERHGLSPEAEFAVRSSSPMEDGGETSNAGFFTSILSVKGLNELKSAISQVWRSGFNKAAVLQALRLGFDVITLVDIAVIIQKMIVPQWAGVAFSRDPVTGSKQILIDAVPGLGNSLVSGEQQGMEARLADGNWSFQGFANPPLEMLETVANLVERVEITLDRSVDIEWAWDGAVVWLLQARPITRLVSEIVQAEPRWAMLDLYHSDESEFLSFTPLPGFAQYFRSKRARLAGLAKKYGVEAGAAYLISGNKLGLMNLAEADLSKCFIHDFVVIDFNDNVRQLIIQTALLRPTLMSLLDTYVRSFVVRDYIRGEAGLVTQQTGKNPNRSIVCEWSDNGLLAINRGTAECQTFLISENDDCLDINIETTALLTSDQARKVSEVSANANEVFGHVQLEWVVAANKLCLVDFSPLNILLSTKPAEEIKVLSAGFSSGKPLIIARSSGIERASIAAAVSLNSIPNAAELGAEMEAVLANVLAAKEPVIIVSPRPYAALAAIVPHVAGFIFEHASILCHLAIVIREHSIPAVENKGLYVQSHDLDRVTVDAK